MKVPAKNLKNMMFKLKSPGERNTFILFLEKISLITSDECIESNILSIEAKKFLEENTSTEVVNNALITNEDDGDEEDLVCRIVFF